MRVRPSPPPRLPVLTAGALVVLALGCAGTPEPEDVEGTPREGLAAAPVWLLQDCAAHWGDAPGGRLCGVGSAVGPANPSLLRSTAIGRGRTQVARQLHARLRSLLEALAAEEAADRRAAPAWDPIDVGKQITDASLSGVALAASWSSPRGTFYALVSLDLVRFSETLRGMGSLPDPLRDALLARAERLFGAPDAVSPDRHRPL